MSDSWQNMLSRLDEGELDYWRDRLALAEEVTGALQAGQIIEPVSVARRLLVAFASDPKWEVRKAIANALHLVDERVFVELAVLLLRDDNAFVRRSAERSYRLRRNDDRNAAKRDRAEQKVAQRLHRLRKKLGDEAADEVDAITALRFEHLAGALAHNLRSVLTSMQPAATAVARGLDRTGDRPDLRRQAECVVDGVDFIERCLHDVERYTEPLPVGRQAEDLADVLAAACEMAAKNIADLGFDPSMVVLRRQVHDGLRLRLSRHLMVLAVANLVKNAYESFMARHQHLRGGEISVIAEAEAERVRITIRDNGMGMAEADLRELLTYTPRRRNKAKRKSTGFGVPIAKRYIEAHGGTLAFESREEMGTAVLIDLPRRIRPNQNNHDSGELR